MREEAVWDRCGREWDKVWGEIVNADMFKKMGGRDIGEGKSAFLFLGGRRTESSLCADGNDPGEEEKSMTQRPGVGLALAPSKDRSLSGITSGSRVWVVSALASVFSGKQSPQLRSQVTTTWEILQFMRGSAG